MSIWVNAKFPHVNPNGPKLLNHSRETIKNGNINKRLISGFTIEKVAPTTAQNIDKYITALIKENKTTINSAPELVAIQ